MYVYLTQDLSAYHPGLINEGPGRVYLCGSE
jgi:hypothetical protein